MWVFIYMARMHLSKYLCTYAKLAIIYANTELFSFFLGLDFLVRDEQKKKKNARTHLSTLTSQLEQVSPFFPSSLLSLSLGSTIVAMVFCEEHSS